MRVNRIAVLAAAGLVAGAGLAGCTSGDKTKDKSSDKITVTATDTECTVAKLDLAAGSHTFAIANTGKKVNEFYIYADGDKVVGEVENIAPGLTRELHVQLDAGTYKATCKPGMTGDGISHDLKVTGKLAALTAEEQAAVDTYRKYVKTQTTALVAKTEEFVTAVKAGDAAKAKTLFPVARINYERIEPIAEALGDIDAELDVREDGVEAGKEWHGFHRIEKDLWGSGDLSKLGPIADALLKATKELNTLVDTVELNPVGIASGAKELLDEVATKKVTGEEDRYSHTDLWDFAGNVEGADAVVVALRPMLDKKDPALGKTIDEKFAAVTAELAKYKVGEGYKFYTELSTEQIKGLADAVNGLAEPVSKVSALVVK